jgi:UDP-GlcNAc:undecaprenyl-phosphate/decaprenyl-phosphate GlcNAc-1-phosphate transferase
VRTAAVAFVSAMLVGAALTQVVRDAALRLGLLDYGLTSRKVHGRAIPRLGGVAIVVAFLAPLAALFFVNSGVGQQFWSDAQSALALFAGGLAIASLGLLDDLRGCNARTKFAVQFAVAGGMYWAGYRIDQISQPFGPPIQLGLFALPFTMLWIAGVINAMNLIDGLDGLAGGVAFIAVGTIFTLAAVHGDPLMLLFTAALGGAILGFLFFNFNPATIFMGDTGSMFLGFVLATTAIKTSQKSTAAVAIAVPILALGIPISDTLLAMGRRALRGAPLFSADRGHIHHRLIDRGLSHRQAVLVIYGGALIFGGAALAVSFTNGPATALVLLLVAAMAFVALRALGFIDFVKAQQALVDRRRNLDMRAAVRQAGERLRTVSIPQGVWEVVRESAPVFGAVGVALTLRRLVGRSDAGSWSEGLDDLPPEALRARFGLIAERPGDDHLDLAWSDGRDSIHRDVEIAIELLCDHVSEALDRIECAVAEKPPQNVVRLKR